MNKPYCDEYFPQGLQYGSGCEDNVHWWVFDWGKREKKAKLVGNSGVRINRLSAVDAKTVVLFKF